MSALAMPVTCSRSGRGLSGPPAPLPKVQPRRRRPHPPNRAEFLWTDNKRGTLGMGRPTITIWKRDPERAEEEGGGGNGKAGSWRAPRNVCKKTCNSPVPTQSMALLSPPIVHPILKTTTLFYAIDLSRLRCIFQGGPFGRWATRLVDHRSRSTPVVRMIATKEQTFEAICDFFTTTIRSRMTKPNMSLSDSNPTRMNISA
ncbi:hypothetical protein L218DRAFT_995748 [Marasmius fiardii PR-910]|nr:hypothetical protein L218DRAFT_995748 [Marasmius fiardii PR-910]